MPFNSETRNKVIQEEVFGRWVPLSNATRSDIHSWCGQSWTMSRTLACDSWILSSTAKRMKGIIKVQRPIICYGIYPSVSLGPTEYQREHRVVSWEAKKLHLLPPELGPGGLLALDAATILLVWVLPLTEDRLPHCLPLEDVRPCARAHMRRSRALPWRDRECVLLWWFM